VIISFVVADLFDDAEVMEWARSRLLSGDSNRASLATEALFEPTVEPVGLNNFRYLDSSLS
jgi:hypothetical protein